MEIHLARDGSALGVFTEAEVREGLAAGRFRGPDLAWRQGMATWTPLAEWTDFAGLASPAPLGLPVPLHVLPAWERGAGFRNFFGTLYDVILNPVATFDALPRGALGKVVGFQYAAGLPAWLCGSLIWAVIFSFIAALGSDAFSQIEGMEFGPVMFAAVWCGILGCAVVLLPLLTLVGAAFQHLVLLPWGPSGGFGQTYRVAGYVQGAFLPFTFIPCLNYLAGPWSLVTSIIGLSRAHRLAWWKVTLSILLLACCVLMLVFGTLGLAGSLSRG